MQHLLVVDFEATCDVSGRMGREQMEIIEIGAVVVDTRFETVDTFSSYVRPVRTARLTAFCKELLQIRQEDVDAAHPLPVVAQRWSQWIAPYRDGMIWGSWGDYDRHQLAQDCALHGIEDPIGAPHVNLKACFSRARGVRKGRGLRRALKALGMSFEGTVHSGLDDARNVVRILKQQPGMREHIGEAVNGRIATGAPRTPDDDRAPG